MGKLIYLSHSRLDIAFAVGVASQYMSCPTKKQLEAMYRILRYLKGTLGRGLLFKKQEQRSIEIYIDADLGETYKDKRSTSGYCSYVWRNLVTWESQKQELYPRVVLNQN